MKREHWLVLFLSAAAAIPAHAGERTAPSYGDDDLARMHPRRGETGALSVPAAKAEPAERERPADAHGEAYWRHEAEKLALQLRPLRRQADALRSKIANAAQPAPTIGKSSSRTRRSARGSRSAPLARSPLAQSRARDTRLLEDQLRALEREINEREVELEERARKESALPGWIR